MQSILTELAAGAQEPNQETAAFVPAALHGEDAGGDCSLMHGT